MFEWCMRHDNACCHPRHITQDRTWPDIPDTSHKTEHGQTSQTHHMRPNTARHPRHITQDRTRLDIPDTSHKTEHVQTSQTHHTRLNTARHPRHITPDRTWLDVQIHHTRPNMARHHNHSTVWFSAKIIMYHVTEYIMNLLPPSMPMSQCIV